MLSGKIIIGNQLVIEIYGMIWKNNKIIKYKLVGFHICSNKFFGIKLYLVYLEVMILLSQN